METGAGMFRVPLLHQSVYYMIHLDIRLVNDLFTGYLAYLTLLSAPGDVCLQAHRTNLGLMSKDAL